MGLFGRNRRDEVAELIPDPGRGNLSAKAFFAATVGPHRLTFGKNTAMSLTEASATQLVRNAPASQQWAYVAVLLPGNVAGPKVAMFSNDAANGFNNAVPMTLQRTVGWGDSFSQVLEPGDMIYARSAPGQGTFQVLISVVWF